MSDMDGWGSAGEWVGGLGSILAAVVALGIAIRSERNDRVLRQLAAVQGVIVVRRNDFLASERRITSELVLVNGSMHPIRDIRGPRRAMDIDVLPRETWIREEPLEFLLPGKLHAFSEEGSPVDGEVESVHLTDYRGQRWLIREGGVAVPVTDDAQEPRRRKGQRRGSTKAEQ